MQVQRFGAVLALLMTLVPMARAQDQVQDSAPAPAPAPESWNAHFQTTYIRQEKPSFRSPYAGPDSLVGTAESSYSLTGTASFGLRLPGSAEIYLDPEAAQGVPMSGLLGLAGFPNGELAKTSGSQTKLYLARLFVRKVVDLGGESQSVESSANQLAGTVSAERLVFSAGILSTLDIFDNNSLAHDPRMQFMNWALMTHAAYDYPADARGYTRGVAAEYIAGNWALRAGRFAVPKVPNQLALDDRLFRHFSDQLEASRDYQWGGQTGTLRLLMFRTRATLARYDDALTDSGVPQTLVSVRRSDQSKHGVGLNLEHHLSDELGVFARAFHADGKTEADAFTEADGSVSAGVQWKGATWGRGDDMIGLGLARSSLSSEHRRYLQQGGTTVFLGDGTLRYRGEVDAEAYYSARLREGIYLTGDVQRLRNPGYNADRGPVSVFSVRMHLEI